MPRRLRVASLGIRIDRPVEVAGDRTGLGVVAVRRAIDARRAALTARWVDFRKRRGAALLAAVAVGEVVTLVVVAALLLLRLADPAPLAILSVAVLAVSRLRRGTGDDYGE